MDKTSPLKEAITGFLAPFLLVQYLLLLFLTQHATHWFPIFDRYRIYACPLLIRCLLAAFFLQLFHLLLRHLSTLDNWGSPTVTDRECQSIGKIGRASCRERGHGEGW